MRFDKEKLQKIFNRANKESAVIAAIMAVFLVCVGFTIAEQVQSTPIEAEEAENDDDTADATAKLKFQRPRSLLKDISGDDEDEEFKPGPDKLNMAYYYADDADTEDAINSYAGMVFQELNTKNASLLAGFYDLTDVTPLSMAQRLGLDQSRVMGKYDPTNGTQDPANPATWTINSFKNVSVSFYDGDGNRINGYYAAQEIMSLASVYMYYHDDYDVNDFLNYCNTLFDSAITSKISMGNVYYCNGCLNKTTQQESAEALAMEAQALAKENKLQVQTAISSGSLPGTVETINESSAAEYTASSAEIEEIYDNGSVLSTEVNYYTETPAEDTQAATSDTAAEQNTTPAAVSTAEETAAQTETAAQVTEPSIEEISDPSIASEGVVMGIAYYADYLLAEQETESAADAASESTDSQTAVISRSSFNGSNELHYTAETEAEAQTSGYAVVNSSIVESSKAFVDENGNVQYTNTTADPANTAAESDGQSESTEASAAVSDAATVSSQDAVSQRINMLLQQANIQSNAESYCPGHIDIYVTVRIRGIDDKNGLFSADAVGNDPQNFNDKWQGWTEDKIAEARALNSQDWLEEYGLSISSINLKNPLTSDEIQNYMNQLSGDVTDLRRSIIEFALNSVGKVPYYWGGKPVGAGYSANDFNTLISPDTRGRILKGLDCSGWVNWVYWSVTGQSLAGQSTGTLVGCGRKISRGELKPGDIIIRVGDDAHVVMFLCWAGDGDFYAIHETGGVINNVTVSKMTANWPYYRSLAD